MNIAMIRSEIWKVEGRVDVLDGFFKCHFEGKNLVDVKPIDIKPKKF